MERKYLSLYDLECYRIAFELSNTIWSIVIGWDYFVKDTVGKQFVGAVDSVSANIAEGFGRYGKKDKIKFYQYANGSVKECMDWNQKSKVRNLITPEQYEKFMIDLDKLPKAINSLIKFATDNLTT